MPGKGRTPEKFNYWSHLRAMLFGQWSGRKSLRELSCPQGQACYPELLRRAYYKGRSKQKSLLATSIRLGI